MKAIALSLGLSMLAVGGGWTGDAARERDLFCHTVWVPVTSIRAVTER